MQHPDEGTIHAWLDGELSVDDAAALEAHVAGCAECRAAVAEARGIIAASSRIVSALDVVPGGVIPAAAARTRPWYASTQLRAAATVLFVAGATLLVINRQDTSFRGTTVRDAVVPSVEREQSGAMTAPSSDLDATAQTEAPVSSRAAVPAPATGMSAERDRAAEGVARRAVPATTDQAAAAGARGPADAADRQTAEPSLNTVAVVSPRETSPQKTLVPTISKPDTSVRDEARARSTVGASAVLRGGVSGAAIAVVPDLKALRTDTVGNSRRTVYEVSPGVQVTLTEIEPAAFQTTGMAKRSGAREAAAPLRAAPAPAAVSAGPASTPVGTKLVISITWSDSTTARSYVLSGPLTKAELEVIRERLAAQKR